MNDVDVVDTSSMSAFLRSGGRLPIVVMTFNRPQLLNQTLHSLLAARGVAREYIYVAQHEDDKAVATVAHNLGLRSYQNMDFGMEGESKVEHGLALHFRAALSHVFETVTDAPGVIVMEDDLLVSPDFYEYFHAAGELLDLDDSLYAVSAWNDNGYRQMVTSKYALRRTGFFPGLGWLLTRKLAMTLFPQWPNVRWDDWLRGLPSLKGKAVVIPEISRTFHAGVEGTYMNPATHEKYFARLDVNTDASVDWFSPTGAEALASVLRQPYEFMMAARVRSAYVVRSVQELESLRSGSLVLWYRSVPDPDLTARKLNLFKPIALYFGIWSENRRGGYQGIQRLRWRDAELLLVDYDNCTRSLQELLPRGFTPVPSTAFKDVTPPADSRGDPKGHGVPSHEVLAQVARVTSAGYAQALRRQELRRAGMIGHY